MLFYCSVFAVTCLMVAFVCVYFDCFWCGFVLIMIVFCGLVFTGTLFIDLVIVCFSLFYLALLVGWLLCLVIYLLLFDCVFDFYWLDC